MLKPNNPNKAKYAADFKVVFTDVNPVVKDAQLCIFRSLSPVDWISFILLTSSSNVVGSEYIFQRYLEFCPVDNWMLDR